MKLSRKYIVLGNGTNWCEMSISDIKYIPNISFFNSYLPLKNGIFSKLAKYHFSYTANKYIELPFKGIWFNCFFKFLNLVNDNHTVLAIYDWNVLGNNSKFLNRLRRMYPNIKLVYIFTNIVKKSKAYENDFIESLRKFYDVVIAFDPDDAKRYDFYYSPLVYSKNTIDNIVPEYNAFYIGKAKGRLNILISIFERLNELKYNCDFHIVEVPTSEQKYIDKIEYNRYIQYDDVLSLIQKSSVLIDAIQGESAGLTIKTCEAICYDKKLITTNQNIKDYPFYDDRYILVIEQPEEITKEFLYENTNVSYSEEGKNYFSVKSFFQRIEDALDKEQLNGKN